MKTELSNKFIKSNMGDLQISRFKFAESPKLFEILSNNLYARKEEAVIRELFSNGYDSHVLAGKSDTPIEIQFNTISLTPSLSIRDFGVGLSPKEIEEVYTVYGMSTKTDSNDYIGAYGIGAKSVFAVTKQFNVTSFHNGTETKYLVFTNEEGYPSITKISSNPTDQTGLEVSFRISEFRKWSEAISNVLMYANPRPNVSGCLINWPENHEITLQSEKWYFSEDIMNGVIIHIGQLHYELSYDDIKKYFPDIEALLKLFPQLHLKLNIGDVELNASREDLQFTQKTCSTLKTVFEDVFKELDKQFKAVKHTLKDEIEYAKQLKYAPGNIDISLKASKLGMNHLSNIGFDFSKVKDDLNVYILAKEKYRKSRTYRVENITNKSTFFRSGYYWGSTAFDLCFFNGDWWDVGCAIGQNTLIFQKPISVFWSDNTEPLPEKTTRKLNDLDFCFYVTPVEGADAKDVKKAKELLRSYFGDFINRKVVKSPKIKEDKHCTWMIKRTRNVNSFIDVWHNMSVLLNKRSCSRVELHPKNLRDKIFLVWDIENNKPLFDSPVNTWEFLDRFGISNILVIDENSWNYLITEVDSSFESQRFDIFLTDFICDIPSSLIQDFNHNKAGYFIKCAQNVHYAPKCDVAVILGMNVSAQDVCVSTSRFLDNFEYSKTTFSENSFMKALGNLKPCKVTTKDIGNYSLRTDLLFKLWYTLTHGKFEEKMDEIYSQNIIKFAEEIVKRPLLMYLIFSYRSYHNNTINEKFIEEVTKSDF